MRHGHVQTVGEGDETPGLRDKVPASQRKAVKTWHATHVHPGAVSSLNRPNAPHWQIAGPKGAIVTEAANFHDGKAIKFTNPEHKL